MWLGGCVIIFWQYMCNCHCVELPNCAAFVSMLSMTVSGTDMWICCGEWVLACCQFDGKEPKQVEQKVLFPRGPMTAFCVSHSGKMLAAGDDEGKIHLFKWVWAAAVLCPVACCCSVPFVVRVGFCAQNHLLLHTGCCYTGILLLNATCWQVAGVYTNCCCERACANCHFTDYFQPWWFDHDFVLVRHHSESKLKHWVRYSVVLGLQVAYTDVREDVLVKLVPRSGATTWIIYSILLVILCLVIQYALDEFLVPLSP